jgi:hypothetical protein
MTDDDAKKLWDNVKANGRALDNCEGPHRFEPTVPTVKLGRVYRCAKCGGEADSIAVRWYEMGLRHGAAGVGREGGGR